MYPQSLNNLFNASTERVLPHTLQHLQFLPVSPSKTGETSAPRFQRFLLRYPISILVTD